MCGVSDQLWTVFRTAARESACSSATACALCTVTDCQRLLPARHGFQCLFGLLRLARHHQGPARPPIPNEVTRALVGWVARSCPGRVVSDHPLEEEHNGTHM